MSHADCWLVRNKLRLNRGKTELLILSTSPKRSLWLPLGASESSSRNGSYRTRKTCSLHLRDIAKIKDSLSQKGTEILVYGFISSKLDSRNSSDSMAFLDLRLTVYKLYKSVLPAL